MDHAERRPITALFCDLVDSTRAAQQLDAEDLGEMYLRFQRLCGRVVDQFNGHVAQYLGDGLLVYFGYPKAEEDDAKRAILAAREIVHQLATVEKEPLAVRIGVATGQVVITEFGFEGHHKPTLAVGHILNLAKRLQEVASPGEILVAEDTRRLVYRQFDCMPLGTVKLKGIHGGVETFRIVQPVPFDNDMSLFADSAATPLVGRMQELETLQRLWREVLNGSLRLVAIVGEAGIGKTRVARALHNKVSATPHKDLLLRCSRVHSHTAFHPFAEFVRLQAGVKSGDALEVVRTKLSAFLEEQGISGPEFTEAFYTIAASREDTSVSTPEPPAHVRRSILTLLPKAFRVWADFEPLLLIVEDVHWADPSTRTLLRRIVSTLKDAPFLVVLTSRDPLWPELSESQGAESILLDPLGDEAISALVEYLAQDGLAAASMRRSIVEKAGGNPLFAEELTRAMLDGSAVKLRCLSELPETEVIPATLQAALMGRLDRLGAARELAQIASFLGNTIDNTLLRAVTHRAAPHLDENFVEMIQRLVGSGLLHVENLRGKAVYRFRHSLLQDVAYGSLVRSDRVRCHRAVAEELETGHGEYEVIAHHYERAGEMDRSIHFLTRAAHIALDRSAHQEATAHLVRARELLDLSAETPGHDVRRHQLLNDLGVALMTAKGFGAEDALSVFGQACDKANQSDDPEQCFRSYWGIARVAAVNGRLRDGLTYALNALEIATQASDPALLIEGNLIAGVTRLWLGEFADALVHYQTVEQLYEAKFHRVLLQRYGEDPRTLYCSRMAFPLWVLGSCDAAVERCQQAREAAHSVGHALSEIRAEAFLGWVHQFRGEPEAVARCADTVIQQAERFDVPFWLLCGKLQRGWARAMTGELAAGIKEYRQALDDTVSIGTVGRTYHRALLVELCIRSESYAEAADALVAAKASARHTGDGFWRAELERLSGELAWRHMADSATAIRHFRAALEIARLQSADAICLRAATSLAQLLGEMDQQAEGLDTLVPIYNTFVEGLETRDLCRARETVRFLQ